MGIKDKYKIDEDFLVQKYKVEKLSCAVIAKMCGCAPVTIWQRLKRHNITTENNRYSEDLTGKQIGNWYVIGRDEDKKGNWLCQCICGKKASFTKAYVRQWRYKNDCPHNNKQVIEITYELLSSNYPKKGLCPLARELGISEDTLKKHLHNFGIATPESPRKKYQGIDFINKIFGNWQTLNETKKEKNHSYILATCMLCKEDKWVRTDHLLSGRSTSCKQCIKIGNQHARWKGYGEISLSRWRTIQRSSRIGKKKEFSITIEYAWGLFLQQNRICALSGLPISFAKQRSDEATASLDRIDSSNGYIEGNVQWVHKLVNKIKIDLPQDVFVKLCKLIAKNNTNISDEELEDFAKQTINTKKFFSGIWQKNILSWGRLGDRI